MVPGKNGLPRLYLCSKIPLHDRRNKVIGLAGLNRPYEFSAGDSAGYSRLMSVITFVTENYARDIEVTDMAEHVLLSVSQLQREFSKSFGIAPNRYLREVRVGVVRHLLKDSDQPLSKIATDCGFYDQSHMTRHFKRVPASHRSSTANGLEPVSELSEWITRHNLDRFSTDFFYPARLTAMPP